MIKLKTYESNENCEFIKKIFEVIHCELVDIYWSVSDLDLVPNAVEYGIGKNSRVEYAWNLYNQVIKEKIVFLNKKVLSNVMDDTLAIRNAVFLCYFNDVKRDYNFRARVEVSKIDVIQHRNALVEIRILDGDLFMILNRNDNLEKVLKREFYEFII